MSDLKPVSKPPFLLEGRGARVIAIVVIAVLIAIVKPWGLSLPRHSAVQSSSGPTPGASETAAPTLDIGDGISRPYDPLIFGDKELQPTWGLWPAGYLVTFGFAMHTESSAAPDGSGGSAAPSVAATADPTGPVWPDAIDIPIGNHLLLIGVSTPRGYQVADDHADPSDRRRPHRGRADRAADFTVADAFHGHRRRLRSRSRSPRVLDPRRLRTWTNDRARGDQAVRRGQSRTTRRESLALGIGGRPEAMTHWT